MTKYEKVRNIEAAAGKRFAEIVAERRAAGASFSALASEFDLHRLYIWSFTKCDTTVPTPESKRCRDCKLMKPSAEFYRVNRDRSPDGLESYCKPCCQRRGAQSRARRTGRPYFGTREKSTTPHATLAASPVLIAWAAGFIEGEGCFSAGEKRIIVTADQVYREPLDRLQHLFGGAIYQRLARAPNCKDQWVWYVAGTRGAGVLMTIYGFLSERRKCQAKTTLDSWMKGRKGSWIRGTVR